MTAIIQIQFQRKKTICDQIVKQLTHLIDSGKLQPGDQLPAVRELAQDLRVNFNTVARAYRQLDSAGKISTQQGRGTFVSEPRRLIASDPFFSTRQFLEDYLEFIQGQSRQTGKTPAALHQAIFLHLKQTRRLTPGRKSKGNKYLRKTNTRKFTPEIIPPSHPNKNLVQRVVRLRATNRRKAWR